MITYFEVFPLLVAACVSFDQSTHAARVDEADGEFLRVTQLVCHLIDRLGDDRTDEFPALFGVVEWVLEEGDHEARSLLTNGFLDDITDIELYADSATEPVDFVPWIGPRARRHSSVQALLQDLEPPG